MDVVFVAAYKYGRAEVLVYLRSIEYLSYQEFMHVMVL